MPSDDIDILLKGGTVYDGSGSSPFNADIGISGDTISLVGPGQHADTVVDMGGFCVCPGFIDVHGHSEFTLLCEPGAEGKVCQGITTEINGNCGLSAAPLLGEAISQREGDLKEYGIKERWSSLGEYFSLIEGRIAINFATLAGHGNIRASVIGYSSRKPTIGEMDQMKRLLEEALRAGAIGLSTGLIYPPGIYSETGEIVELAAHGVEVSGGNFIYATHMRSEGEGLLEAIEEAISIGRESGARVHISHIKTAGRENWHKIDKAIALIDNAHSEGVQLTCDRYPYTAGSTGLDSVLPDWIFEGGNSEELRRLKDPSVRERLKGETGLLNADWGSVYVSSVSTRKSRWMEGLNMLEIASRTGNSPIDAVLDVLIDEGLMVGAVFYSMSEDNLRNFLKLPYVMMGTDSSARSFSGPTAAGKPHPRGFGTFPRFLKTYAGNLEDAIRRVTSLPAETFGIRRRGYIREGFKADIVAFDPANLTDKATYEDPFQPPEGIHNVIVNGVPVLLEGKLTGERPGSILKSGNEKL
jgi:N-acyl-D-amino-acid deacylase